MENISPKAIGLLLTYIIITFSCKEKLKAGYIDHNDTAFISANEIPDAHFLGDAVCKKCHADQFKSWEGSHHDKAMQTVSDSTVLANFNTTFKSQGVISKFFKKDGEYYVNTEGPDGKKHDYKIEYTFGITPLQQYIVKFPNGHYQCLRTAWDSEKNKWFDLYPDFKVVHSEWLHWSRGGLNWNNMCSDCHSTNVRENYNEATHSYDTKFSIINVSCEACHGPGKDHVTDVNRLGDAYRNSGKMKMTLDTPPKELVDQCARCHMRREQFSGNYNFEGTVLDHYYPQLITEGIYHPDGQILDEDYVYGSFVQSKMYHNDVTCTNCHDAHSLELKFKGNNLCAQCHVPEVYDTPKHHFHNSGSEGAQCINCHMSGKYYMGNDFRRDHSFRIPRPDLSLKYDVPNACTQCHKDKSDDWAWENFKAQYGVPDYKHFSELLAPGLTGAENGMTALQTLAKDTIYPEIARASAVRAMSNYLTSESMDTLLSFLNDESSLVKGASIDVLSEINASDYVNYFLPLLKDNKRSVRVKAFFAISALDELQIPTEYKDAYHNVKREFEAYLNINADFVGGRVKRANHFFKKGDLQKAIQGYESALAIDNINNNVRINLANLYYTNQQYAEAEEAFKTIIEQEPEYGPTYYSYALLLAELNRTEDAIENLKKAILYMPQNMRCYYNLSLLYDKMNNFKEAEKALVNGLKIDHRNESLLYTLAYLYSKHKDIEKAKNMAARLLEMNPQNPQYINFYRQLSGTDL
ncbi:tetratricopeptide repeat protein [Flavivirga sp. 57AJ16]|uniref:tetratricopeptide repeat protein n=1 Tax=Flavivirga sp. 57AJ16 TaxID=3025307 RepID=UPI002365361B|nr:tetratricopeptide repeat protein [Flavivirga sp. 57AJ16]MDD7885394.1 tetratricopeptide repeat protein [Flavivirga sp. 57AJ16]